MFKRFTCFVLTLCLAAGLTLTPVLASEATGAEITEAPEEDGPSTDASNGVTVTVRIENSFMGQEQTLLPPTEVTLESDGDTKANVYNALIATCGTSAVFTESEYGSFLSGIMGVTDETGMYSWMFAVNNAIPEVGMDAYELNDGDEVVFYFVSWEHADYAYFTPGYATISDKDSVTLNLSGVDFMEGEYPVEGAQLVIVSDSPTTRDLKYTDAEGNVELSFMNPGEYLISAVLTNDDGINTISHPYCLITVEGDASAPESPEPELTTDSGLEGVDTQPEETPDVPLAIVEPTGEPAEEPAEPIDFGAIEPMPMPTAPVTYDEKNNTLNVYGADVNLSGVQVIFENNELYLPLRAVAEALGLVVTWDGAASVAIVQVPGADDIRLNAAEALAKGEIKFVGNHIYVPSAYVISNYNAVR